MLANVVTELKGFEEEEEQKGIFGFFKKQSNKLEAMKTRYNKAEANIDQIVKALEGHQIQLAQGLGDAGQDVRDESRLL